jgi:hypothetical protein
MNGPNKLVLVFGKPFQPHVMPYSSLLGPFVSYIEDNFIFFVAYEWA